MCNSVYAGSTSKPASIVVTIKPLYSLLAHLTDGISKPELLLKQIPSAHYYNLRPSQRSLLANADMIVWIGPEMESYLNKIIQPMTDTTVVSAISAKNLQLLQKRNLHQHDENNTGEFHHADPHIWLSTHNAIAISKHLSQSLARFDPLNRERYEKNLSLLINKIKNTSTFMQKQLSEKHQTYIAYHDAYQYLESELGLIFSGAVSFDENAGTSLKHARQITSKITHNNIRGLVFQAPKPAIVSSLQSQTSINAVALDPLGLNVKSDKDAWFELMQEMAVNFKQCLTAEPANTHH